MMNSKRGKRRVPNKERKKISFRSSGMAVQHVLKICLNYLLTLVNQFLSSPNSVSLAMLFTSCTLKQNKKSGWWEVDNAAIMFQQL